MNDRLKWILSQINKLMEDGNVRYEGNGVFQGLRQELESVLAGYDESVAALIAAAPAPAPVVQTVMSAEQVQEVIGSYDTVIAGVRDALLPHLGALIHDALEASDVAVMAAINAKGDDVVASLAK